MQFASLVSRTQLVLGVALMGSSLALAAACSSTTTGGTGDGGTPATSGGTSGATSGGTSGATSGGTSGATSGGTSGGTSGVVGGSKCGGMSTSTCTQSEIDSYNNCNFSMCDAEYQAALGSNYKTGSYAGACGTYITCTTACPCGDSACTQKCGLPDMACQTAIGKASSCSQMKCPPPACFKSAGTSGGTSGTSGGASGTSGTTMHTCADLATCCAAIADASTKSGCDAAAMSAGTNESTCNSYYDAFKTSCP